MLRQNEQVYFQRADCWVQNGGGQLSAKINTSTFVGMPLAMHCLSTIESPENQNTESSQYFVFLLREK